MSEMRILTIDPGETKKRIKADGRTPPSYARLRSLPTGTLQRILNENNPYPHTEKPGSEYQKILRLLHQDGYLVEKAPVESKAA